MPKQDVYIFFLFTATWEYFPKKKKRVNMLVQYSTFAERMLYTFLVKLVLPPLGESARWLRCSLRSGFMKYISFVATTTTGFTLTCFNLSRKSIRIYTDLRKKKSCFVLLLKHVTVQLRIRVAKHICSYQYLVFHNNLTAGDDVRLPAADARCLLREGRLDHPKRAHGWEGLCCVARRCDGGWRSQRASFLHNTIVRISKRWSL